MRGIRGAITVEKNQKKDILKAVEKLITTMLNKNKIKEKEIVSIIFTATNDLDQEYPAVAVRDMGFNLIPLMCYQEMQVQDSLNKCIRAMIYINRDCGLEEITHVYLKEAQQLRPDLIDD